MFPISNFMFLSTDAENVRDLIGTLRDHAHSPGYFCEESGLKLLDLASMLENLLKEHDDLKQQCITLYDAWAEASTAWSTLEHQVRQIPKFIQQKYHCEVPPLSNS